MRRSLLFDFEREALISEFEKHGIWYMPLKGIIIKDYYPGFGMREMSDNDILFDPAKRKEVYEIFMSRGYSGSGASHSNHDVYKKEPVLCFEMHTDLFKAGEYPTLAAKYENVKDILLEDAEGSLCRHLSDEDFYVFIIAHAYKHYSNKGTGIRTLTDILVLNRQLGAKLRRDYVDEQLDSFGILSYEKESRQLAWKLFGSPAAFSEISLTADEERMLDYYLNSGIYGNTDNRVSNRLQELSSGTGSVTFAAKLSYMRKRLFPGPEYCRKSFPFFYKHPVFMPVYWVWRLSTRGLKRTDSHKEELLALKNKK